MWYRLTTIKSVLEMKKAVRPLFASITPSTRRAHASSKFTPSMPGRISTATGSLPKRMNFLASARSSTVMLLGGAPKLASAA
jgi:hypothetical protein